MSWFHRKKKDDLGSLGNDLNAQNGLSALDQGMNTGLNEPTGNDMNMGLNSGQNAEPNVQGQFGSQSFSNPNSHAFNEYNSNTMNSGENYTQSLFTISKEIEVISSKLDAIKATLDSLNQRVSNIERVTYGNTQNNRSNNYRW